MIATRRPPGARASARRWAPPAVVFVLLAAGWQLYAGSGEGNILLPTFSGTVSALVDLVREGELWRPLLLSNETMLVGYLVAVAAAIPVGFLMGRFRWLDRSLDPWVAILVATPMAPLLPIIVIVLGLGIASGVVVVFLFSFVYMVINTRAGIRNIDPSLTEMARSFGAGELARWRYVLIPGAMPAIATGLRICLGRAFAGMILGELLMFARGIGQVILDLHGGFQSASLFAVVGILLIEALLLAAVMRVVEARITRRFF
jgi:ABC-type nitrate/sulfonate/bicarbonate transport system permease component